MKLELIQPFINAADAVLAQSLQSGTSMGDVTMEAEVYRRKGVAAVILITGDIEGRVVLDLDSETAARVASLMTGTHVEEAKGMAGDAILELSNLVIGNAVTSLNDLGFHFKVHPPEVHQSDHGFPSSEDTEAVVMRLETSCGPVFLNLALRYNERVRALAASAQ
jgi:chemotaxis protein CheX